MTTAETFPAFPLFLPAELMYYSKDFSSFPVPTSSSFPLPFLSSLTAAPSISPHLKRENLRQSLAATFLRSLNFQVLPKCPAIGRGERERAEFSKQARKEEWCHPIQAVAVMVPLSLLNFHGEESPIMLPEKEEEEEDEKRHQLFSLSLPLASHPPISRSLFQSLSPPFPFFSSREKSFLSLLLLLLLLLSTWRRTARQASFSSRLPLLLLSFLLTTDRQLPES